MKSWDGDFKEFAEILERDRKSAEIVLNPKEAAEVFGVNYIDR